jgi:hypothetical protein
MIDVNEAIKGSVMLLQRSGRMKYMAFPRAATSTAEDVICTADGTLGAEEWMLIKL